MGGWVAGLTLVLFEEGFGFGGGGGFFLEEAGFAGLGGGGRGWVGGWVGGWVDRREIFFWVGECGWVGGWVGWDVRFGGLWRPWDWSCAGVRSVCCFLFGWVGGWVGGWKRRKRLVDGWVGWWVGGWERNKRTV